MWCHVRLINSQNRNTERINKQDKKIAGNLTLCLLEGGSPLDTKHFLFKNFSEDLNKKSRSTHVNSLFCK